MSEKILIAYFSASGVTAGAADKMSKAIGADLYEIRPEQPYTSADLDWTNKKSRSTVEMTDPACRPAIAEPLKSIDGYDVILLGFPVWWGVEPRIVDTFSKALILPEKLSSRLPHPAEAVLRRRKKVLKSTALRPYGKKVR